MGEEARENLKEDVLPGEEVVSEPPKQRFVTFMTGEEYFGVKIEYVNEIIVMQDITNVPENEDYLKGLINLRGKIIPVIDVRVRFGLEPLEYTDRTCIIIIQVKSVCVGLIVEKIAEVVEIDEKDQLPSPTIGNGDDSHDRYVYAVGKVGDQVKLLLNVEKLLSDEALALE